MRNIPYGRQYIDNDDIEAVTNVLKSDWLTQGPNVEKFEELVAEYHNCKYAVAFSSGTAALHAAYYVSTKFPFGKYGRTLEDLNKFLIHDPSFSEYQEFKKQYWEFITSPITFVASANGGLYCGGSPKFVDIDLSTYCIDINKIESRITDSTRVITPVSYAGYPIDIEAIKNLPKVKENNICIIHDACHAMGARINGAGISDFADMTILSFHPVKNITTGEGGMVLTNHKGYYEKLLLFRNHGITKKQDSFINKSDGDWYYEMQELGYNYRITDIQCILGISQMEKTDLFLYKRNLIANQYNQGLRDVEWIKLPPGFSWTEDSQYYKFVEKPLNLHSYHLYPIVLDQDIDRNDFYTYLRKKEIGVQVHYYPVENQVYYRNYTDKKTKHSVDFYNTVISLPIFPQLGEEEQEYVIEMIKNFK